MVIQLLISVGGNSLYKELLESQGYDVNTATTSAFVQHWNKILPSASNEGRALAAMVDRSPIKGKTIVIADRGYESYSNFAHLEHKGWNYVIGVKDSNSSGILSGLHLPSDVRDIHLTLTKKQNKVIKAHPEIYKFVPSTSTFDFLDLQ